MQCRICERACIIPEGKKGACGQYQNRGGEIVEIFPERYLVVCPISIETMPILHFYPGGKFLQISTAGCNFNCSGCISTTIVKELDSCSEAMMKMSAAEVIAEARNNDCLGITFLMNDPLASFPTFLQLAKAAKKEGMLIGCSSNTYFTEYSLAELSPYLDFINIGLKGLREEAYRSCGGSSVQPVLRNLKKLYADGVHIEISCIYENDNRQEILSLAGYIAAISKDIPLQIMRFIPLENADPKRESYIRDAEILVKDIKKYLHYVYLFNSPGTDLLNTFCPTCGEIVIQRDFYGPMGAKLFAEEISSGIDNTCSACGEKLTIIGNRAVEEFQESGFQGGYPFTRALEIVEAILIAIGVKDKKTVVKVWEELLSGSGLEQLHHDIQNPQKYIASIRKYGEKVGLQENAENLADYMEEKIAEICNGYPLIQSKPRVYYCMGKPLFCLNGERFENQMIELAGGLSVNKEITGEGRPGRTISASCLNTLNPDIVFISAFLSSSIEDFYKDCYESGVDVEALRSKKIYNHLAPVWDFGSPRWILGLMHVANLLHPDIYHFDMAVESQQFYRLFYNTDFILSNINRSFSKADRNWTWSDDNTIRKEGLNI